MKRLVLPALLLACAEARPRAEGPPETPALMPEIVRQEPSKPTRAAADLYAQAVEALAAGRDASPLLEETLREQPDHALASENLTRLRIKQGRVVEAEKDLAVRVGAAPGSLPLRVQFVRVLIAENHLELALTEAKRVLKADERNVPALVALADIWYRQHKYELARDVLETAAQLDAQNGEIANAQGFVHLALGQKPLALEDFKRACALSAGLAEAHNNLGALLNEAGDYEGATRELQTAAKLQPDRAAIWLNLGNAHRGVRRDDEAEKAYRKSLELDPRNPDPLFNLALLYLDARAPSAERMSQAKGFFDLFANAGGADPRLAKYRAEAEKGIGRERDRASREERERLKQAELRQKREKGKLGTSDEDTGSSGKLGGEEEK